MKIKKVLSHTFTVLIYSWVGLQFFSCSPDIQKVKEKELATRLQNTWQELKKENLIHGSILIQKGSEVLFADGDLNKVYPIASISKSFVGLIYFHKSQQGLKLDTPVCHWLKNFCTGDLQKITLQQLLDHKSGFGRDLSLVSFLKRSLSADWNLQDIDTLVLEDKDLNSAPGKEFGYSNFGYLVLSRVLEIIEQKNFSQILQEHVPTSTTAAIQKGDRLPAYALVPGSSIQWELNKDSSLYKSAGAGGIKSSALDLMQWLGQQRQTLPKLNKDKHYSLGWVRSEKQSYQAYWHNGATPGFYSLVAVIPESDLRIVILTDNYKFIKHWSDKAEAFEQYLY
ncbi:serine hydrolase domain-containing protein [Bdellovibrio bacteriovorus]|uniref:serine hydrolase domain-containing protein n=1 Tax=Bdellovibrio bacteriovorus TaxID=959 RepID=UPI003AA963FE